MATSINRPLGIVIPTRWEARDALKRFGFQKMSSGILKADIGGRSVFILISGVGREAARKAAGLLVAEGAKELVSMGFCGALVPALKVGDLVTDRIATVDKPVRNSAERRALTARANAIAVDMETQAVIEEGTRRGVPIHILRVVSDDFEDDLSALFGSGGSFSTWSIAFHLLNPKVWPLAMKLRRQSRIAGKRLAEELGRFCGSPLL